MKGILLSLGILIPTILPSQIRLVPFPGIFSTYIGAHLSKRQFCLRPLSRGLFFNRHWEQFNGQQDYFSSPLSGTFFQSAENSRWMALHHCFRPLSWGLFFNPLLKSQPLMVLMSLRPLSRGPFFNPTMKVLKDPDQVFSSPFLGTCFQLEEKWLIENRGCSFRPLSWGLFFNTLFLRTTGKFTRSFRPLSRGPFFQWRRDEKKHNTQKRVFVPFLGDLFSMP